MDDFALTPAERALLAASNRPKDIAALPALEATIRARDAGPRKN